MCWDGEDDRRGGAVGFVAVPSRSTRRSRAARFPLARSAAPRERNGPEGDAGQSGEHCGAGSVERAVGEDRVTDAEDHHERGQEGV